MERSMTDLSMRLHFSAVGQGLFSQGTVECHGDASPDGKPAGFNWVYDCGTSSNHRFISREISLYKKYSGRKIDLLILSHFDRDHISGIKELLSGCSEIDTIVMPYLTFWQRINIISSLLPGEEEFAGFILRPNAFLHGLFGKEKLPELVFILPGGMIPKREIEVEREQVWPGENMEIDDSRNWNIPDAESWLVGEERHVYFIDASRPWYFKNLWEFCFFNRRLKDHKPKRSKEIFRTLLRYQENGYDPEMIQEIINTARDACKSLRCIGGSNRVENEISVVTYSGPAHRRTGICYAGKPMMLAAGHGVSRPIGWCAWCAPIFYDIVKDKSRCSILYTGDITIDGKSWSEVSDAFGTDRMSAVSWFQVPHHGARQSMDETVARAMRHDYSVFSSENFKARYGHPSEGVVRALEACHPVFANEHQSVTGCACFRT